MINSLSSFIMSFDLSLPVKYKLKSLYCITSSVLVVLSFQFSSVVQSCPTLCETMDYSTLGLPVHQQLLELAQVMPIRSVMSSNHLILCHPLLLLPSIIPSIRVFSSESVLPIRWPKYWSFSFNISLSPQRHPASFPLKHSALCLWWAGGPRGARSPCQPLPQSVCMWGGTTAAPLMHLPIQPPP